MFRELPLQWIHPWCQEGEVPQIHGDRRFCAQDPSGPHPVYLFICLFIISFIMSFINKPVNVSKVFSLVLWAVLANYCIWSRSCKNPQLITGWSEVEVARDLWLAFEVGAVLRDWALNLWDLRLTPGSVRIEWSCRTPAGVQRVGELVVVARKNPAHLMLEIFRK